MQLDKSELNGTPGGKTPVSLAGISVTVFDHAIDLDLGAAGLDGNANMTVTDGYYQLGVVLGSMTYKHEFYHLLGDVTPRRRAGRARRPGRASAGGRPRLATIPRA